jgi:hypothetical protein
VDGVSVAAGVSVAKKPAGAKEPLYKPLDFFLARAPLLPVQVYRGLADEQSRFALASDPLVRRALSVGSASLVDALERHKRSALVKRDADRMNAKLLRYEIRMSTRPTPFGLFAGVAVGHWGPSTDFRIVSTCARTRTRPDMAWLTGLVHSAEAIPAVRRRLHFQANPLAAVEAGRVVLPERTPGGKDGQATPVSVRATEVVKHALLLAKKPISYEDLVARLSEKSPSATREKLKSSGRPWEQTFLLTDPSTADDRRSGTIRCGPPGGNPRSGGSAETARRAADCLRRMGSA